MQKMPHLSGSRAIFPELHTPSGGLLSICEIRGFAGANPITSWVIIFAFFAC